METQIILSLTKNFENVSYKTEEGIEFWLARDLQKLLGYSKWNNFTSVIDKAKLACKNSQENISNHFAEVGKSIEMPKNASRNINDVMLTRYACYLIAQNGDSKKEEIAFAQTYFALQTRKAEIIEQKILASERVNVRNKLKETEKELSKIIFEQTRSNENFALIRSKEDHALFNKSTLQMKNKWKIKNKPLADFMPTILLKAKDFATEITIFNTKDKYLNSEKQISNEHITNNKTIRKTLVSRGIIPENLPQEMDIKKVERKLSSDSKKSLKNKITFNNSKN